jgi:DNA-binding response OmpR family regulator
MKVLVVEDEVVTRTSVAAVLTKAGLDVLSSEGGLHALDILQREPGPVVAIIDWLMPGLDGIELCRRVRLTNQSRSRYLILLTARDSKEDVVTGLRAGADDYVTKPFHPEELLARVHVGVRVMELHQALQARVQELEDAVTRVRQLEDLLPICCYCKKVRDDQNYWEQVEDFVSRHYQVRFSHGICPDCFKRLLAQPEYAGTAGVPAVDT